MTDYVKTLDGCVGRGNVDTDLNILSKVGRSERRKYHAFEVDLDVIRYEEHGGAGTGGSKIRIKQANERHK